jgi:rSAM/selenodomain-associated transferase 1
VSACVVVFAREPVPGRVKSRLAATLGDANAARVYEATLEHTLDVASRSGARVVLSLADAPSSAWVYRFEFEVEIQHGNDLGARLEDVFARRFGEGEGRVVVIGSDCPWIFPNHIAKAVARLSAVDAVFGPATDGGYWLVAQRQPGLSLFENIPWSQPETLERTRQRLVASGGTWSELEELVDIDTMDDLDLVLADPRTPDELRVKLRDIHDQSLER